MFSAENEVKWWTPTHSTSQSSLHVAQGKRMVCKNCLSSNRWATVAVRHCFFRGGERDAVDSGRPGGLHKTFLSDVDACCDASADSMQNLKSAAADLYAEFDISHPCPARRRRARSLAVGVCSSALPPLLSCSRLSANRPQGDSLPSLSLCGRDYVPRPLQSLRLNVKPGERVSRAGPAITDFMRCGSISMTEVMRFQVFLAELQSRCAFLNAEKESLSSQLQSAERVANGAQAQLTAKNSSYRELQVRYDRAVDENEVLRAQLEQLQELQHSAPDRTSLSITCNCDSENSLFALMQEVEAIRCQYEAMMEECLIIKKKNDELSATVRELSSELSRKECSLSTIEVQLLAASSITEVAAALHRRVEGLDGALADKCGTVQGGKDRGEGAANAPSGQGNRNCGAALSDVSRASSDVGFREASCSWCHAMRSKYRVMKKLLVKRTQEVEECQELIKEQQRYLAKLQDL